MKFAAFSHARICMRPSTCYRLALSRNPVMIIHHANGTKFIRIKDIDFSCEQASGIKDLPMCMRFAYVCRLLHICGFVELGNKMLIRICRLESCVKLKHRYECAAAHIKQPSGSGYDDLI